MSDSTPDLPSQSQPDMIILSPADQAHFVELLLNPPPLVPAMERALKDNLELFQPEEGCSF